MRSSFVRLLAVASSASAAAVNPRVTTPTTTKVPQASSIQPNACAYAKAAAEYELAANPEATIASIKPSLARECLYSIPVDKENDLDLLNYLEPYVSFQSTLEGLADPPEGYLLQGIDVLSGFGQIRAKLNNDEYGSQVEFMTDVRFLFGLASDGHFGYSPAIFNIFGFVSASRVVSVADSVDSLPRVYLQSDFFKDVRNGTDVYDIESIDGVPIVEFLENQARLASSQDPDAKYNNLFSNIVLAAQDGGDAFVQRFVADCPDEEVIKFTNGTTYISKVFARIPKSAVPYMDSAKSLHEQFELPSTETASSSTTTPTATSSASSSEVPTATQIPGYPEPVAIHAHEWISGYFLETKGYEDVAVLSIPSFSAWSIPIAEQNGSYEIPEAGRVAAEFLQQAKDAGKKKLIIDVQGNGGGFVGAGFQLYNQLFPNDSDIWDGNRLRAHVGLEAIGTLAEQLAPKVYENIADSLNADRKPFKDFADLYGPELAGDQNVTKVLRYNQSDIGYTRSEESQLFEPANIVVITDGACASTCTIFTGLLEREQGVRTIALGGRPLEAAMQAVGGVKGAQVLQFSDLQSSVIEIRSQAYSNDAADVFDRVMDILPSSEDAPLLPLVSDGGSFNYRNAYARGKVDGYPEQFIYEAANCRLFYTDQMVIDPVAIWTVAADTAWNKGKCVKGSTVNSDGTIGDKTVAYDKKVDSKVDLYEGPGSSLYEGDYEAPQPYVQRNTTEKRSESTWTPPSNFEYEVIKHKVGRVRG